MIKTSFSSETEPLPLYALDEWWTQFNASNQYSSYYLEEVASKSSFQNIDQQSLLSTTRMQLAPELFASNNVPLAVMAMHQKVANADLLVEYFHLAQSVQFMVVFSLKNAKPLSLFSSSIRAYLFKDLYNFIRPSSSNSSNDSTSQIVPIADPVLCEARYKFLHNVITSIVQTLPVYRDGNLCLGGIVSFYIIWMQFFFFPRKRPK